MDNRTTSKDNEQGQTCKPASETGETVFEAWLSLKNVLSLQVTQTLVLLLHNYLTNKAQLEFTANSNYLQKPLNLS